MTHRIYDQRNPTQPLFKPDVTSGLPEAQHKKAKESPRASKPIPPGKHAPLSEYAWVPQPGPQLAAIEADWCEELFFGGARYGGKSDFLIGDFLQDVDTYGQHWQGIIFRESLTELENLIQRSHQIYPRTGAQWKDQKKQWIWPNGACLRMRYFEREADISLYQGHSYSWIGIDELGNWAHINNYKLVRTCLRYSGATIPTKRLRATGNPGGIGQHWIAEYFIFPAPSGYTPIDDPVTGITRMYIPSRVRDNKIGLERDPNYVNKLKDLGSPALVKAWLEGDWTALVGAYFPEFSIDKHVIPPFTIPEHWMRFGAMDWGSAAPFVFGWFAISDGEPVLVQGEERIFPKGAVIMYRECYGAASPGVGLRLDAEEAADMILSKQKPDEKLSYAVLDPSAFRVEGGPSIAERCDRRGLRMQKADNSRIPGWDALRARLRGQGGEAGIYIFSTCPNTIRTIPALMHDEKDPEDVNSRGDDHCGDMVRYAVMSRPYVRERVVKEPVRFLGNGMTLNDLYEHERKIQNFQRRI